MLSSTRSLNSLETSISKSIENVQIAVVAGQSIHVHRQCKLKVWHMNIILLWPARCITYKQFLGMEFSMCWVKETWMIMECIWWTTYRCYTVRTISRTSRKPKNWRTCGILSSGRSWWRLSLQNSRSQSTLDGGLLGHVRCPSRNISFLGWKYTRLSVTQHLAEV